MYAYVGKIAGHSGTDFKHKKVYSNSGYESTSSSSRMYKIAQREDKQSSPWFTYIKIVIVLSSIFTFLLLIHFLAFRIDTIHIHRDHFTPIEKVELSCCQDKNELEFKQHLFETAQSNYKNGNLVIAHEKLYALLLDDKDNRAAEDLLLEVLETRCKRDNYGCRDFRSYSDALDYKYNRHIK